MASSKRLESRCALCAVSRRGSTARKSNKQSMLESSVANPYLPQTNGSEGESLLFEVPFTSSNIKVIKKSQNNRNQRFSCFLLDDRRIRSLFGILIRNTAEMEAVEAVHCTLYMYSVQRTRKVRQPAVEALPIAKGRDSKLTAYTPLLYCVQHILNDIQNLAHDISLVFFYFFLQHT